MRSSAKVSTPIGHAAVGRIPGVPSLPAPAAWPRSLPPRRPPFLALCALARGHFQRGLASDRRDELVEIGIAIGIEIETLREKLDRDFDPDFDFDFDRTGARCAAEI
jgi:hypothetical protein